LPIVASLLAYGLAVDTTVIINTTGVSSDGVLLDVNAPANMNFSFDFTQSSSDTTKASWTGFQSVVSSGTPAYLKPTGTLAYTITVTTNANYQLVVGVPTVTGTGFPLSRYQLTISWPGSPGTSTVSQTLDNITAPWTAATGSPGQTSYTLSLKVFVKPTDVPSGYNQTISIPLTIVPTP
jgi:hypothetical protein